MTRQRLRFGALGVFGLLAVIAGGGWVAAHQQPGLKGFMRQKLELSQQVLRGLTTEDYETLTRSAAELRRLSEDAQWKISPHLNYIRLSGEFQAITQELERAARARNLDGAALAYVDLTLNCVKCHKLVREERLITREGE